MNKSNASLAIPGWCALLWAVVAALCLTASPARAGGWEIEGYYWSGLAKSSQLTWYYSYYEKKYFTATDETSVVNRNEPNAHSGSPSSISLGTSGLTSNRRGAPFLPGVRAGVSSLSCSVYARLVWKRDQVQYYDATTHNSFVGPDLNDNPPPFIYVRESGSLYAESDIYQGDGNGTGYSNLNRWQGNYYELKANNSMGLKLGTPYSPDNNFNFWIYDGDKRLLVKKIFMKGDQAVVPSQTFGGTIKVSPGYEKETYDQHTNATLGYSYQVDALNVSIDGSPWRGAATKSQPDFKEFNAYAKQNYHLNGVGEATTDTAFWDGTGSYTVTGSVNNAPYSTIFNPQLYKWELTGSGTPFIPEPNGANAESNYLPSDNAENLATKEFHLDLGSDSSNFPQTSIIWAKIIDGSGQSPEIPTHVVVHWNLPRWFVTKASPVTTITGDQDPDRPGGPVNPPADPNNPGTDPNNPGTDPNNPGTDPNNPGHEPTRPELTPVIRRQTLMTRIFWRCRPLNRKLSWIMSSSSRRSFYIGHALEAEKAIAEFYATGPLFELGGAALDALIGKGAELLASAAEARQTAAKAAEIAAEARRLAQEGRALGKSSEDIARLEQDAADADRIASEATQDAEKFEQEGQKAQREANEAKAAQTGCFIAGTPVLMGDESFKPIEQLKVGDQVLARDPATVHTAIKKVLRVTVRPHIATLILHLADGQSIETTANHPFFVSSPTPSEPAKSVAAGQLAIGNSIVTRAGPAVAVKSVEQTGRLETVYNCTVEDFHTYFVGQSKLWVHNVDCDWVPPSGKINRPNVTDPDLVDAMDNLWRPQDQRPGGTISELLREKIAGLNPPPHLEKAQGRLTQLINRVTDLSRPLSPADREAAERVISDLKYAVNY